MSFTERRRAPRVDLNLPVVMRWKDGAEIREVKVTSDNASEKGVYFALPECIENGTPVELDITFPHKVVWARASGHVRRCEVKENAGAAMAVEIEKYEFVYK